MENYIQLKLITMLLTIGGFVLIVFAWAGSGSMRSLPIVLIAGVAAFLVCCAVSPSEQEWDADDHK